ncbi:MAG: peptidase S41 [Bacteroidetes bacterium]|nr:peptidase S41 [Bacteroidota bacterium]MBT7141736.1 peptidase S41 [Bacteroidota bacterium]MBT7491434.1 peptidase S41 [Bacteroidota bacterium]
MKLVRFLLVVLLFVFKISVAQVNTANSLVKWYSYPSISPDGKTIVFSNNGDLFKVSVEGGQAQQLTSNVAYDYKPIWSNDNEKIVFASNRHGNFDVFVISKNGGVPNRLTYYSGDDFPCDFNNDNSGIIFSSNRIDNSSSLLHHRLPELYEVEIDGGNPRKIFDIPAIDAKFTRNGELLFDELKGFEDKFRKHHTTSITRDIWIRKNDGTFKKLTNFVGEDRNAIQIGDDNFYFLSEQSGSFNVFKSSLSKPNESKQITKFSTYPIRNMSVSDNGTMCFSYNGDVYTQIENGAPNKIDIKIFSDKSLQEKLLFVKSGASEIMPSPNGKEIFFIYRGEVFVTTVDGTLTKQITKTPEKERSLDVSPDGRSIVYAGERNNSWNLYTAALVLENEKYFVTASELSEEPLLVTNSETFQPIFSPDGKEVAFLEERTVLKVIEIKSKKIRVIHDGANNFSYADGDQHFEWSPDGKWFLIEFFPTGFWTPEIGLISSTGKEPILNLSKSGFDDFSPNWTQDGEMLFWMSNKQGLKSVANSGFAEVDIFGMFLNKKSFDKFNLSKEEFGLIDDKDKKKDDSKDKKDEKEKKKKDKEKELTPVKIDFSGLTERKKKLTIFSANISDAVVTKKAGKLLYFAKIEKAYDLWQTDLRTKETKLLTKFKGGPGKIFLDKDEKHLLVLSNGKISKVDLSNGKKKPVQINGEMLLDESAERLYLFDHISRQVEKKFLFPDMEGIEWENYSENYRQFIPNLTNNYDFKDILSELLGELNVSHTGARYRTANSKADKTASFGVFYNQNYEGQGFQIEQIMEGSPLVKNNSKIKEGTIIEKIDGVEISKDINYFTLLNRKAGKTMILSLFDANEKSRWTEKIKPISLAQEDMLEYKRWIKRNRDIVHKLSDGKIGYMHVKSMSDQSFREFIEDVLGEEIDKKALIVDTRFNTGGDLVDDLTTFLSGEKYMEFKYPGKNLGFESRKRWTKPSLMLVAEANYSDAHCVPVAYSDLGIGKTVGMPVPGTCSFVWWERLQNGIVFGIPNMAVTNIDGEILENKQFVPDFVVKNEFEKITKGIDQQILKAVEELLKEIE